MSEMRKMILPRDIMAKKNNEGFTLIEVIIAVVIMTIAAIPILHAFSTTATTSGRALVKMRATNAAENIMEDIKGMPLEDIIEKYGDPSVTYPNYAGLNTTDPSVSGGYVPRKDADGNIIPGGYEFELTARRDSFNKDINEVLDKGYTATIQIDPTYYPNINTVNMSGFDEVSGDHSAIVNVGADMDKNAVNKFVELNSHLETHYVLPDAAKKFAGEYKREIRIVVTKKGDPVDIEGETVIPCEVTATISYLLYDNALKTYVPDGTQTQKLAMRKAFSNVANNNKLNSVFVMFNPLYENAKDLRDIIVVHNADNIPFNLYIIAQNGEGKQWEDYRKHSDGGLVLEIYEKKGADGKHPITLYTNLHDAVDYQRKTDSDLSPVQCYLNLANPSDAPSSATDAFDDTVYRRIKNRKGSWENTDAAEELNARDIDGKLLNASGVEDKIYDVRVTVKKDYDEAAGEWPTEVTLTGTFVDE